MLFTLVLATALYLAVKLVPPYWTYFGMQDPVKEAAMAVASHGNEAGVRSELILRAKEQGLALDEENIEITREGTMLVIRVSWVAAVDLPRYRFDIPFRIEERVPAR